ncbi:MAG TPA: hypothetical protein VGL72_17330 [Bryobacteraceae bacterium]
MALTNGPAVVHSSDFSEGLAAVGDPGVQNQYQVNFRLPSDTVASMAGAAMLQVSSAWIPGIPFNIFVRSQN